MATIGREEQERRAEGLRQFRHSAEMEGGRLSAEAERDLAQYVRQEVDEAEMLRRARDEFGLSE